MEPAGLCSSPEYQGLDGAEVDLLEEEDRFQLLKTRDGEG